MSWGISVYNENGRLILDTSNTLTHYSHTVQSYRVDRLRDLDDPDGYLYKAYFSIPGFKSDGTWFYTQPIYYRSGVLRDIEYLHQTYFDTATSDLSFIFVDSYATNPNAAMVFYIDIMRI